jgi:hypothetical protein
MSESSIKVGEINESGFLQNLFRKGFSFAKSLSEIHANSIDAKATNITYVIDKKIRIIDDGCGMDQRELKNAFSMYNSNHSTERTIGVSGIGLKASLVILGAKSDTMTVTKKPDGEYLTLYAPWKEIFEIGKYTDMITIRSSTEEEIIAFNKEREKTGNLFGTTTIFEYNECIAGAIKIQFEKPKPKSKKKKIGEDEEDEAITPEDRFSVIFGRFPQNVYLINKNKRCGIPTIELPKYNYFGENETEYYDGVMREKIIFMKIRLSIKAGEDERDRYLFIWESSRDGKKYLIKKKGTGWMKSAEELITGTPNYEEIGEAHFICGQRKYKQYFDENDPKIPDTASKDTIHPYDKENIGIENDEFLGNMQIYRNNQMLGIVVLPGNKISSSRANPESFHKILLTHCTMEYNPISRNDNLQDLIIGIQECKTQFNSSDIPKNLLNLLAFMRNEKANEIWNYFEELFNLVEPYYSSGPSPSPEPLTDTESDTESDPESNTDSEPKPKPESDTDSEPKPNPESDTDSEPKPKPESDTDSEPKPNPESDTDSDTESVSNPKPEPKPKLQEVKGILILSEISKFTDNLNPDIDYSGSYFELYNLLRSIN